jgi:hypothetical protein
MVVIVLVNEKRKSDAEKNKCHSAIFQYKEMNFAPNTLI